MIQVWRDGHSISDPQCPKDFSDSMAANIEDFVALLREKALPEPVKNDIRFLLSCMHRDAPAECVQWIIEQVQRADINDPRAVGFALGGVPLQWQKDVLSRLAAHLTGNTLKVFAYAIWRERHFVEKFSFQDLQAVLDSLKNRLITITSAPQKDVRDRSWRRATVEILELLLGLLRARASSDPEIKMLLQPHQNITKELAKQVERVMEIVAQSNVTLISRVQINLQKPHGDRTPDLLFALRLYLTGDDGANAIHISSVSGNDDD